MNLVDCYRVLGLTSQASFRDIKVTYRQLARQYHPDVSAGDQRAKDKFIEVTAAYKFLLNTLTDPATNQRPDYTSVVSQASVRTQKSPNDKSQQHRPQKPVQIQVSSKLTAMEYQLKVNSYQQLQTLLRGQRLPRAIALVEGLARRLPNDAEVTQWQAIVYQQWGRQLIREHQFDKARLYLKKALRTDPNNRSLWAEVEKDFRSIEQEL